MILVDEERSDERARRRKCERRSCVGSQEQGPLPTQQRNVGQGQPTKDKGEPAPMAPALRPRQQEPGDEHGDDGDHEQVGVDGEAHRDQKAEPRPPAAAPNAAQPEPCRKEGQKRQRRIHFAFLRVPELIGVGCQEEGCEERGVAQE